MSKLWLLTQSDNTGYDTYDSAVVCADTDEEARKVNPGEEWGYAYPTWARTPDKVTARYIGEADPAIPVGDVILSSFNAG